MLRLTAPLARRGASLLASQQRVIASVCPGAQTAQQWWSHSQQRQQQRGVASTVGAGMRPDGTDWTPEEPMSFGWNTLLEMQQHACTEHADRNVFGTKQPDGRFDWITYAEFGDMVDRCRGALAAAGLERGDKMCIISKNRVEWAVAAFAGYGLGIHAVPMYEQQQPSDWEFIVNDSGAKALLVATEDVRSKVGAIADKAEALNTVVCFEGAASDPDSFKSFLDSGSSVAPLTDLTPKDLATLIYTSGTTGQPKGVKLTHGNIVSNVQAMRTLIGDRMNPDSVSLSFLPWAHIYGQTVELYAMMSSGAAQGLAESPKTLLDDIKQVSPTVLVAVPTVYNKVYDAVKLKVSKSSSAKAAVYHQAMKVAEERRRHFDEGGRGPKPLLWAKWKAANKLAFAGVKQLLGGRLHYALTGGAALSPTVQEWFDDIGIPIIEGYGLTETSPCVASERFGPTEATQGGLRAVPGVTIHICEPDSSKPLPAGEEGEICVSGPNVMEGYHNRQEATDEVLFTINGARTFRTGDLGRLSKSGVLSITGRVKEQYKLSNGKFVVPGPVEDGLRLSSMFVAQSFVWGLNKPHNVMLIVPNFVACAEELGLTGDDAKPAAMVKNPAVQQLMELELSIAAKSMKAYCVPEAFMLLEEEFTVENGLLTPKMSMKRPVIAKRYKDMLEGMYEA